MDPRRSGIPPPAVALPLTRNGLSGATVGVRTEMTPPSASDPYATEPGPRATSIPSIDDGSRKVALGPTRRSDVTRAPSMRSSTRPRAMPRIAGTAACPSDTWLTPGTVSSACRRCSGERRWSCVRERSVVAAAGAASMLGAAPTTVTDSSPSGSTWTVVSASIVRMSTGFATCPPGRTTTTWNGGATPGPREKRPSASVFVDPAVPAMVTIAPATGVDVCR